MLSLPQYLKIFIYVLIVVVLILLSLFIVNICRSNEKYKYCIDNLYSRPNKYLYRLGDMIDLPRTRNLYNGKKYHIKHFPDSIVSEYFSKIKEINNYNILADIVKRRNLNNIRLSNNICVIHLRVGDTVNIVKQSVTEIVNKSKNHYTPSFPQIMKCLNKLSDINKIIIVAGSHKDCDIKKSCKYLETIRDLLINHGYEVDMRLGNDADEDFVFMCMAPNFIASGGNYSKVIVNTRNILKTGPTHCTKKS